ncbi:SusD/RagB family nutrient-binding outer membrane lipoprotein [Catalinimonas niigatensis]|uniref:SusD/RagB family nutrient-binding outer membrane lipoprotein n=1 Tax=Catalinimonas niigatensis TaxID=1397264 RepID=UPI0026663B94|nr:SusD/RagB family nutrient-binding outer membrane lipoprotein [Catalinimonas niigatensis]WPP50732.1 SusD/RagB family nutrient-binding outer membrane lipoprotein [Catalinimonas niigatensis]
MKNIYLAAALLVTLLPACDDGLAELNENPDAYSDIVPEFLFTKAQLDAVDISYFGTAALTIGGSMQQFATYKEVPAAGDKYFNDGYSKSYFSEAYPTAVNQIQEVIRSVSENPEDVNKLSVARIWRVYIFHHITDLYGDVPYTEAGKGSIEKIYTPKYDEQSFIYEDMLTELEEAAHALDPSQPTFGNADLMYGGSVEQWEKFAYSLMLRLGMRLSEVDATAAQNWVQKAITGGVILEDSDLAAIEYVDGSQIDSRNPIAWALMRGDYLDPQNEDNVEGGKLAKTFIDHLKNTGDPRLNVFSVLWVQSPTGEYVADTATALQQGMPNAAFNSKPADFASYSEPNPNTILKYDAPLLVLTNAEVHLLLAEAAVRGWYNGDAAEAYESAVRAGMRQWSHFGSGGEIATNRIDAYVNSNPFPAAGTLEEKMEAIHTQKWVSLFLDEYEIFAEWRRTGYPDLVPTNYPGNLTGGSIPTRFVLPDSEETINGPNFLEAVSRQGEGNLLTSKVWWDK